MNTAEIKTGATVKLVRQDFDEQDFLDRVGLLEQYETAAIGDGTIDPVRVYNGTVVSTSSDGAEATITLDKDDDSGVLNRTFTIETDLVFVV